MKNVFIPILLGLAIISTTPVFAEGPSYNVIFGAEKVDFSAPQILHVQITPSVAGAIIQWDTDTEALSYLEYGQTPAYGIRMPDSDALVKSERKHTINILGLQEFRTYHFRIKAKYQGSNNEVISRPLTFTTAQSTSTKSSTLFPTPADFSAPALQSLELKSSKGMVTVEVIANEEASLRFEYGPYVKGDEFSFDGKEMFAGFKKSFILNGDNFDTGVMYGYRITTQDTYGSKGTFYGTLVSEKVSQPTESRTTPSTIVPTQPPRNSVLITHPSHLIGIPKSALWKDEKSGRMYRVFNTLPPGAVLVANPSEIKGLTSFQIWKDEKTGRLYKHAGIPNPEFKKKEPTVPVKNQKKDQRPSYVPKQWIPITHPVQLQVLRSWEVWKDKKTGALYRIIEASVKKGEEKK